MEDSDRESRVKNQLNRILLSARKDGASDVHFKVGYKPIFRLHGKPGTFKTEIIDRNEMSCLVENILSEDKQTYLKEHKNVDASLEIKTEVKSDAPKNKKEKIYRHRVNVAYAQGEPYITIRLIPDKILGVDEIGFPYDVWKDITGSEYSEGEEVISGLKRGLVLVTGVTGSGKTTTLASLIHEINKRRHEHIITLEDPVEYVHNPLKSIISQREIGTDLDSFAEGVKYSLRQDPDIIFVGEIRDRETALHALEATETGHIVFSTLHTKNASETVRRYVNLFESEDQDNIRDSLAANLAYVFSQQLIPCEKGTQRSLAMEVLNIKDSAAIRKHLREGEYHQIPGQMQIERAHKSILMDDHLKQLYNTGKIEKEIAIMYAYNPERLKQELDKPK